MKLMGDIATIVFLDIPDYVSEQWSGARVKPGKVVEFPGAIEGYAAFQCYHLGGTDGRSISVSYQSYVAVLDGSEVVHAPPRSRDETNALLVGLAWLPEDQRPENLEVLVGGLQEYVR